MARVGQSPTGRRCVQCNEGGSFATSAPEHLHGEADPHRRQYRAGYEVDEEAGLDPLRDDMDPAMDGAQRDIGPGEDDLDRAGLAGDQQQRHQSEIEDRHLEQVSQIVRRHLDRLEIGHRGGAGGEILAARRVAADVGEALDEQGEPDREDKGDEGEGGSEEEAGGETGE